MKKQNKKELIARYELANRQCALLILAQPERYGGPQSLMVRWARMIINGYQKTEAEWRIPA